MSILENTLKKIEKADQKYRDLAEEHIHSLTMPDWALGRLLDLAVDLAGMTRDLTLPVARKEIILMAGDHGIVRQGVCPQPSSVTGQMLRNFATGGAGINAISSSVHAGITLVDMGIIADVSDLVRAGKVRDCKIAPGTQDFSEGRAMTREQAQLAVEHGIRIAEELASRVDVFGTGEMGIGNTSPASAIVTVLSGEKDPSAFVGRGAGLAVEKLAHKSEMIRRGIECNRPDPADGLDVLSKIGGFEIGGIAGVVLGAASLHKPVVIDGFISSAGALIAGVLSPASKDYMILAHGSAEPGHAAMAKLLGSEPLLDLGMRLGEGTGAALAMPLLDAASSVMNKMSTFEKASVTTHGITPMKR